MFFKVYQQTLKVDQKNNIDQVLLSTFGLLLTCSLQVWCVYDWKKLSIGYMYTHTSQIDCFLRVHKIFAMNRV